MITEYYTTDEIRAKIADHDYNAELLLQHAMFRLGEKERELEELDCWVKHEFDSGDDSLYNVRRLRNELAEARKALEDATTSLRTLSTQAGRIEELSDMSQIRGYANSRYNAAREAGKGQP